MSYGGREALVVGVNAYASSPVRSYVNDATDVDGALNRLGFRTLLLVDCGLRELEEAVAIFHRRLAPGTKWLCADTTLRCMLSPSNKTKAARIFTASISQRAEVLESMQLRKAFINIIILDACRLIPGVSRSTKAMSSGFAAMTPPPGMTNGGTVIAYSTAAGQVSYDYDGLNGRNSIAGLRVRPALLGNRSQLLPERRSHSSYLAWALALGGMGTGIAIPAAPAYGRPKQPYLEYLLALLLTGLVVVAALLHQLWVRTAMLIAGLLVVEVLIQTAINPSPAAIGLLLLLLLVFTANLLVPPLFMRV
ncbi:hypothetical protein T492DRAFT_864230 [Pavlovales sp. CCMP2436]|nr:hypothetical protein T492DRAFT_864230 [Pavlovales sp. CCMP2436]